MTKDSDHLAGTLETEKTGFFAEENQFDRHTLWRIGTWGVAAVGAVVVAVMANQTSLGLRRDQRAAADLSRQAQQLQSMARDGQSETRRLAAAVDTLNNDRDRLFARVTVLEQGLDSVTGTIAGQSPPAASMNGPAAAAAAPKTSALGPAASAVPADSPDPQAALPAIGPVVTAAAMPIAAEKPHADTAKPDLKAVKVEPKPDMRSEPRAEAGSNFKPETRSDANSEPKTEVKTEVKSDPKSSAKPDTKPGAKAEARPDAQPDSRPDQLLPVPSSTAQLAARAAPPGGPPVSPPPMTTATISMMGPPDPAAAKLEPLKAANAGPAPAPVTNAMASVAKKDSDSADPTSGRLAVQRTEFAVDLGTANSVNGLRALWRGLLKANASLAELHPIIVIKEANTGLGMQLRLAAGPLRDAAAAAKICAALVGGERTCETTVYDGQRLAMSAEEPLAKPAAPGKSYRRYPPRHAANVVKREEPPPPPPQPPKPEPSSISSLFRR